MQAYIWSLWSFRFATAAFHQSIPYRSCLILFLVKYPISPRNLSECSANVPLSPSRLQPIMLYLIIQSQPSVTIEAFLWCAASTGPSCLFSLITASQRFTCSGHTEVSNGWTENDPSSYSHHLAPQHTNREKQKEGDRQRAIESVENDKH